jgi:hypothetical protein
LNAWTNLYETWYVYHGTWAHLNGVFHKSLPSVCVPVCVSLLSLLGNGSVKTFPGQRIYATIEEFLDASFSMRSASYQRRVRVSALAVKTTKAIFSKLYFDANSEIKILWPLSQATASNHSNAFTSTLLLSEGRAGEAWEPSYKMMLFPLPSIKCLSLLPWLFT